MVVVVSEKTYRLAYEDLESAAATGAKYVWAEYVWKDNIGRVAITFATEEDAVAFKLTYDCN